MKEKPMCPECWKCKDVEEVEENGVKWFKCSKCGWNDKPMPKEELTKLAIEIYDATRYDVDSEMVQVGIMRGNRKITVRDYLEAERILEKKVNELKE